MAMALQLAACGRAQPATVGTTAPGTVATPPPATTPNDGGEVEQRVRTAATQIVAHQTMANAAGGLDQSIAPVGAPQIDCAVRQVSAQPAVGRLFETPAEIGYVAQWNALPDLFKPCVNPRALGNQLPIFDTSTSEEACLTEVIEADPVIAAFVKAEMTGTFVAADAGFSSTAIVYDPGFQRLGSEGWGKCLDEALQDYFVYGELPELPAPDTDAKAKECLENEWAAMTPAEVETFRRSSFVQNIGGMTNWADTDFAQQIEPRILAACKPT